jgi:hypothetical protein
MQWCDRRRKAIDSRRDVETTKFSGLESHPLIELYEWEWAAMVRKSGGFSAGHVRNLAVTLESANPALATADGVL